jgi:hypothetical protein
MIAWTATEDALAALVASGTGLPVVWGEQNATRPSGPYVAMRVTSLRPIGQDWSIIEEVEDPEPGAEVVYRAQGVREATVSLQCFAGADAPAGIGASAPRALLERLVTISHLQTKRHALNQAGVGLLGFGPVQSIDGRIGGVFEPRAVTEMRLMLASEAEEFATFVEGIEVNIDVGDDEFQFDVGEFNLDPPQDVSATPGDEENVIAWTDSPGATAHHIYWDTVSSIDLETATKEEDVSSPFAHTGLVNETEYFYVVTAESEKHGESEPSELVSATPEESE